MFRLFDIGLGGLAAVVLAGGRGHCFAMLDGEPLLAHVIRRIGGQVDAIALSADPPLADFEIFRLPLLADAEAPVSGPLTGIAAGLAFARSALPRARGILTVPGDAPFLPTDLVKRLSAVPQDRIAVARRDGVLQPTIARWPIAMLADVQQALRAGEDRIAPLIERLPHGSVDFDEPDDPFFDPETPDELARAHVRLAQAAGDSR